MNHLHINVPNVKEAQLFFEHYFGFKRVYPDSPTLFLMDAGGFLLALDASGPGEDVSLPEWFHFGLCRNEPEWARSLYVQMKADGVHLSEFRDSASAVVFFCRSPGGYRIEVRGNKSS
jgi:catechol 2,3-dioxygenase-like lactoylglutathione lyase family enzyme